MPARVSIKAVTVIVVLYSAVMAASLLWINPAVTFAVYWPPGGFLLGCLLLRPSREWPAILGLTFLMGVYLDVNAGRPVTVGVLFSVADVISAIVAAGSSRRLLGDRITLADRKELFELVLWSAGACGLGSFVGAGGARVAGATESYVTLWLGWFLSTFASVLIVTPAILAGTQIRWREITRRVAVELVLLTGGLSAITWLIFHRPDPGNFALSLLVYAPFPLLIVAALKFGVPGAALSSVLISIFAVWGTVLERGPLKMLGDTPSYRVIWLLTYLSTVALSSLVLACVLNERTLATNALRARERRLRRHNRALQTLSTSSGRKDTIAMLREITEASVRALDVTRAGIWLYDERRSGIICRDMYEGPSAAHTSGQFLPASGYPAYFAALDAERIVAVRDARVDPRTRELADSYLIPQNVASMLDAQIRVFDDLVGVVCHEQLGEPREWSEEERTFARSVSAIVALAIEAEHREQAEDSLRESEKMFRTLAETAASSIFIFQDGRFVYANSTAETTFGYSRDELLAIDPAALVHPDDLANVERHITARLKGEAQSPFREVRAFARDGRLLWIQFIPSSIRFNGQLAILLTGFDVTELKFAGERIQLLNEDLERRVADRTAQLQSANEKLKELDRLKSEFLATMSHELRTPLNSIIGFTGVLLMGLPGELNVEQRKQLGMVNSSAKLLLSLINDLLDLSRIGSGRMDLHRERFDLVDVIDEVCSSLQPQIAAKSLELRRSIDDGPHFLVSDRKRCFQILLNLINNAVKFTEHGHVEVQCRRFDDWILVSVTDSGIGIKPENMQMLFEAFRQVDGSARRHYEGTGLGLYLCKKLLDLLGGEIWAESDFGKGSVFSFTLPADSGASKEARPKGDA